MQANSAPKFWSISLEQGKPQKVTVPKNLVLTLSNVCVKINGSNTTPARFFVMCTKRKRNFGVPELVASLYPQQIEQESINFRLAPGESAEFSSKGPHQVDVIGYLAPPEFDDEEDFDDDDDDDVDDYSD